ncbi:MAG: 2-phosphosulfolactate phosphatase [Clostridia bacterium]|nr:2-phosphosulfolactate phosphatase [Clostridia bacterium]
MYRLTVYPTWQSVVEAEIKDGLAVVIDVFRASNTIITALNNGAKEILPVSEIETAWELKEIHPDYLLGGERNSIKIQGFDLGNSPLEYTGEKVSGKGIIFATSNGSRALKSVEKAQKVWVASFANIGAITEKIQSVSADMAIVCSGTLGTPSLEDTLAAGKIINELSTLEKYTLNDYGLLAWGSYQRYKNEIFETLLKSRNGRRLMELGKMDDIKYCIREDITDVVPQYDGKAITLSM